MAQQHDEKYLELVNDVLENGVLKPNRTGVDTLSVFAREMRFDLSDGTIPLLTTKKMHTKSIIHEIIWYLSGSTNIRYLQKNGVTIWDEWADKKGNLGPVYGKQWRRWGRLGEKRIDQIAQVIDMIQTNPDSRRLLVTAWNPEDLPHMALPPCHYSFQFWVCNGSLSMLLNQRSCDVGLGVPFNIVQYSILLHMVAKITKLTPGEFIWRGGDVHIYVNHEDGLREQLYREPYDSPTLKLNESITYIDHFEYEDFEIVDYKSHPTIKLDVAV